MNYLATFNLEGALNDNEPNSVMNLVQSRFVTFPSGDSLSIIVGRDLRGQEYYDPNQSGNPLLDASGQNRSKHLSQNFTLGEFAHSGKRKFEKVRIDIQLIQALQKLRDYLGRPIRITSGYRSYKYNIEIYEDRNQKPTMFSQHMSGRAADIRVKGLTGLELGKTVIDVIGCNISMGIGDKYIHLDVRPGKPAFWGYGKNKKGLERQIEDYHQKKCTQQKTPPKVIKINSMPSPNKQLSPATRKGKVKGLKGYASVRLDQKLIELRKKHKVAVSNEEIDIFQRIADVETRGAIQGINTWDSAVVSSGFMQWTLQHGKLQEWIERVPDVFFSNYNIAVDPTLNYKWGTRRGKPNIQKGILGVLNKNKLRWGIWADRFYRSGLNDEIILAEIVLAQEHLKRHLMSLRRRLKSKFGRNEIEYQKFKYYYDQSPYVRGMFQSSFNNRPASATKAVQLMISYVNGKGSVSVSKFENKYVGAIKEGYGKDQSGVRIPEKTAKGSSLVRLQ